MTEKWLNEERLTAYVLDELDESERASVEKELETDAEAQRTVEELQATAKLAREALEAGSGHTLSDEQRQAIAARADETSPETSEFSRRRRAKRTLFSMGIRVAAVVLAVVAFGSLMVPNLLRSKLQSSEPGMSPESPPVLLRDIPQGLKSLSPGNTESQGVREIQTKELIQGVIAALRIGEVLGQLCRVILGPINNQLHLLNRI